MSDKTDEERERFIKEFLKAQEESFQKDVEARTKQKVAIRNGPHLAPDGMKPKPVLTQADHDKVSKEAEAEVKLANQAKLKQALAERDEKAKGATRSEASQAPDERGKKPDLKHRQTVQGPIEGTKPTLDLQQRVTGPRDVQLDFKKPPPPPPPPPPDDPSHTPKKGR